MGKTLVIHPADPTTDCLKVIYEGKDWTVINDIFASRKEVETAIEDHDRIIMLGHGTPYGLLCSDGQNRFGRYIVDAFFVPLLQKKETLSIWCNSNLFFEKFKMKGVHTGMIISEVAEEFYTLNHAPLNEDQMAKNMELFCGAFAKHIDEKPEEMVKNVLQEYVGEDEVTEFNRDNIIIL